MRSKALNTIFSDFYNKLWKILKEIGIPDHLTCLLRRSKAAVRTGYRTTHWF